MSMFIPFWWDGNQYRRPIDTQAHFLAMKQVYTEEAFKKARRYKDDAGDLPVFGFNLRRQADGAPTFEEWAHEQGLDLDQCKK